MRRRDFVALAGAGVAWPLVVQAQAERLRRVAVLMDRPAETDVLELQHADPHYAAGLLRT